MKNRIAWYELLARRGALDKDEQFAYQLLVNGDKGESELLQVLLDLELNHFWWRRNFWLARQVECDLIFVTHSKIYVLNAKYYNGEFAYRDHVAYFNGKALQSDPVSSFQLSLGRLKKLLAEHGIDAALEGRLVFMNPNYKVTCDDSASLDCVPRYDLLKMFQEITADSSKVGRRYGLQIDKIGNQLLALESDSKYNLPTVNDGHLQRMRVGLFCPHCRSGRGVGVGHHYVTCQCRQYLVSKQAAVLDAILEYGQLFHHKSTFTTTDIYQFLGGQIRRRYISNLLLSKYERIAKGHKTAFINPSYRNPDNYEKPFR